MARAKRVSDLTRNHLDDAAVIVVEAVGFRRVEGRARPRVGSFDISGVLMQLRRRSAGDRAASPRSSDASEFEMVCRLAATHPLSRCPRAIRIPTDDWRSISNDVTCFELVRTAVIQVEHAQRRRNESTEMFLR